MAGPGGHHRRLRIHCRCHRGRAGGGEQPLDRQADDELGVSALFTRSIGLQRAEHRQAYHEGRSALVIRRQAQGTLPV
jgi:hypothetical protein